MKPYGPYRKKELWAEMREENETLRWELQKTQGGRWDDLFKERYRLLDENRRLRDVAEHKAVLAQSALDSVQKLEAELERLREENDWWNNLFPGEEECDRLRRIEEAARTLLDNGIAPHLLSGRDPTVEWDDVAALRAALQEEA